MPKQLYRYYLLTWNNFRVFGKDLSLLLDDRRY
jgi:hypothetical protein